MSPLGGSVTHPCAPGQTADPAGSPRRERR
jgi:hypothetical protein